LFAYGLSEPDVGGDLASVTTRARRSDDGRALILDGFKRWCTGADWADYIYCLVRSDDDAPRYRNLSFGSCRAVRGRGDPPIEHANLRYTLSCDVNLRGARVPIENLVGGEAGWNRAGACSRARRSTSRSSRSPRARSGSRRRQ